MLPVHADSEDRVQIMLRVFDLDPTYVFQCSLGFVLQHILTIVVIYRFGPSMGMSRLDRWKRAEELGMDPPEGVRRMLDTKQGRLGLNRSVLAEYTVF